MTLGAPTAVRIFTGSHRCHVIAGGVEEIVVDGDADVSIDNGRHTIDRARGRLRVRVPSGLDVIVGSTSGRIEIEGRCGAVSVSTESGRVEIEAAATADARTSSSRVEIGEIAGACRVHTKSGKVTVERCGSAEIATDSARIELKSVHGPARAHAVSGRIEVRLAAAADVDAETVTGRIEVTLPVGVVAHRPEPGDDSLPPPGADCTVRARSTTGKVEVVQR